MDRPDHYLEKKERLGMVMRRYPVVVEFHCARCDAPKTAKNVATILSTGAEVCNGCYGELCSKGEKQ